MKDTASKETLNQLVADLSQMSMVIHQTHWYMRGTNFLKLHPFSTLREMAANTKIKDGPGNFDKTTPEIDA